MDISKTLKASGIKLESTAFNLFGAEVRDKLSTLLPSPTLGLRSNATNVSAPPPRAWDSNTYASNIASGAGRLDPKTKFLFKVMFEFNQDVRAQMINIGVSPDALSRNLSFTIKAIDLPKVDFEYEEVNMYNFHTQVLKRVKNTQMTMEFYDDSGNNALSLMNAYMKMLMPSSRRVFSTGTKLEDYGFAFDAGYQGIDTAARGMLPGSAKDIITFMKIEQFYVERGQGQVQSVGEIADHLVRMNTFTFTNPRITRLDTGSLDHESGANPNMITAQMEFDALNITVRGRGAESQVPQHPQSDILFGVPKQASTSPPQDGGNIDPFSLVNNRRDIDNTLSAINKAQNSFGNKLLGAVQSEVKSLAGTAAQKTLNSIYKKIPPSIARPAAPILLDVNSTVNAVIANVGQTKSTGN